MCPANAIVCLPICFILIVIKSFSQQASNYNFTTNNTGSLVDMSSGTTLLVPNSVDDFASTIVPIGFDFWFMGQRYQTFSVSDNGAILLGNTVPTNFATLWGSTFPQPNLPIIAPYYGDMRTQANGRVHYRVDGLEPNRVLTIEFDRMSNNYASSSEDVTCQARLYETTGQIEYIYGAMNVSTVASPGTSVQLRIGFAATNTNNNVFTVNQSTYATSTTATGITNTKTVGVIADLNSASNGSRRTFSFLSPQPTSPSGLTFSAIQTGQMTLNWTDNSSNETAFAIYRSDNGGVTYQYAGQTPANTTSFVATGLSPNTNYFWRVFAVSEGHVSNFFAGGNATTLNCTSITTKTVTLPANPGTVNWNALAWVPAGAPDECNDVQINWTNNQSVNRTAVINLTTPISVNNLTLNGNFGAANNLKRLLLLGNNHDAIINGDLNILCNNGGSAPSEVTFGTSATIEVKGNATFGIAGGTRRCGIGSQGGTPTFIFKGNVTKQNTGFFYGGGTWIFAADGAQQVTLNTTVAGSSNMANVTIGQGGFTDLVVVSNAGQNMEASNTVTISENAHLTLANNTTFNRPTTGGGSFSLGANAILTLEGTSGGILASNFPANFQIYNLDASSEIQYNAIAPQEVVPTLNYGSISFNGGLKNMNAFTAPDPFITNVRGQTTISSGTIVNIQNQIVNFTLEGCCIINDGTLDFDNSLAAFTATTNQNVIGSGTTTFSNILNTNVNGLNFLSDVAITDDITNNGVITASAGNTVTLNGANDKTFTGSGSASFENLRIDKSTSSEIVNLTTEVTVNNDLILDVGFLNIESTTLRLRGGIVNNTPNLIRGGSNSNIVLETNVPRSLSFDLTTPGVTNRITSLTVEPNVTNQSFLTNLIVSDELNLGNGAEIALNGNALTLENIVTGNGNIIGDQNAIIRISGTATNAGTLRMNQASNNTKTLDSLIIAKTAGAISIGNELLINNALNVEQGTINTGGNIILLSDNDRTARIAPVNGTINGYVNQQRFINFPANQWFELGSPVNMTLAEWQNSGLIFTGFLGSQFPSFPTNNAYRYNTSLLSTNLQDGWGDGSGTDNTQATNITNAVNRGQAWKIFGAAGNFTLNNIGEPASGAVQVDLVHNTSIAADQSWNFVSNPYCSPVNWEEITRNNVHNTYYIYRRTGPNSYQYATYQVGGANTMGQTENIGIGQGFWVRTTGANPNLTFNQNDKTAADPGFVRDQMLTEQSILKLSIRNSSNNFLDETAIVFNPNAQEGDDAYDAVKLYSNDSPAPSIAQINSDNSALVFNHLPKDEMGAYHIPLEVKIKQNGTYIFSIPDMQNLDDFNHCMYFFDSQTQEYMALDEFFEYGIPLTVGSYTERFYITISRGFTYQNTNVSCFGSNDASITFDVFDNVNISFSSANEVIDVFNQFNIVNNLQAGAYTLRVLEGSSCAVGFEHEIIIESPEEVIANFTADRSNINLDEESETGIVHFQNLSEGANNFQWVITENGSQTVYYDEEISHTFTQTGVHSVFLNISNGNVAEGCVDSFEMLVTVSGSTVGINSIDLPKGMRLLTTSQGYQLAFDDNFGDRINLSLYSADGKLVWQNTVSGAAGSIVSIRSPYAQGIYSINLNNEELNTSIKLSY
jgi:hypothetical protein